MLSIVKRVIRKYLEMKILMEMECLEMNILGNAYLEINHEEINYLRTNNPAIDINLITL